VFSQIFPLSGFNFSIDASRQISVADAIEVSNGHSVSVPNEAIVVSKIIAILSKLTSTKNKSIGVLTFSVSQRNQILKEIKSRSVFTVSYSN